ncbi:MAG TPA: hypothetical protein VKQ72_18990, partial [Aggregatilineales bacterium]|nr:hypothetical protein [Aggregatilineales bacterium]
ILDLCASAVFERPYNVDGYREDALFIPPASDEYAIVVAASLAQHFLIRERALGFVTYNPLRTFLQPDHGNRQFTRILEALAVARSETPVTCEQLIAVEGHHMGRGTTIIIVTADPSDNWIREATLLVRRGLRTVAVVVDAQSFGAVNVRSSDDTRLLLEAGGVPTYGVRQGDNISVSLSLR